METSNGRFYFEVDDKKKVLFCFAEGLFTYELGNKFNDEFMQIAKKNSGKGYSLIVDAGGVKACNEEATKSQVKCLQNYVSDELKYNKYFMIKLKSPLAQHQTEKSVAMVPGFSQRYKWVASKEEAYRML